MEQRPCQSRCENAYEILIQLRRMKIKNIRQSNKCGIDSYKRYKYVSFLENTTILTRREFPGFPRRPRWVWGSGIGRAPWPCAMGEPTLLPSCAKTSEGRPTAQGRGERINRIEPASVLRRRNQSVQFSERIEQGAGRRQLLGAAPGAPQSSERFVSPLRKWANGLTVTRLSSAYSRRPG